MPISKNMPFRTLYFLKRAKTSPSKLLPARRKTSDGSGVWDFPMNRDRWWTEIDNFFTVMNNRVCDQTDLSGFFDPAGYGILGCPMFHRSARISNRLADRPAKPDLLEYSSNCSATRTARHGRNRHSSGVFTFFSFEEGSNFVQNILLNIIPISLYTAE